MSLPKNIGGLAGNDRWYGPITDPLVKDDPAKRTTIPATVFSELTTANEGPIYPDDGMRWQMTKLEKNTQVKIYSQEVSEPPYADMYRDEAIVVRNKKPVLSLEYEETFYTNSVYPRRTGKQFSNDLQGFLTTIRYSPSPKTH